MKNKTHRYIKYHICENQNSDPFRLATIRQNLILDHCTYEMYSPEFATTTAPPMSKYTDYRIRE